METHKPSEHVLIVYKELFEQINYLKRQQWTITNYIALCCDICDCKKHQLAIILSEISVGWCDINSSCVGVVALVIVQHDLGQARQRINNIEKGIFSSAEQSLLDIQDDTKAFTRGWFFPFAFTCVLLAGAALIVLFLFAI